MISLYWLNYYFLHCGVWCFWTPCGDNTFTPFLKKTAKRLHKIMHLGSEEKEGKKETKMEEIIK